MIDTAFAQTAPGIGGPGPMMTIFPFILIFVILSYAKDLTFRDSSVANSLRMTSLNLFRNLK